MRFKRNISILEFISVVADCDGNVTFRSPKGDKLDLKSNFNQYFFVSMANDLKLLYASDVQVELESDKERLRPYLMDQTESE